MQTTSDRSLVGQYVLTLAAASLIPFMVTACTVRQSADTTARRPLPRENTLEFENSTVEPVSVFVEERGLRWLVGYVRPGEAASFRLPVAAGSATRHSLSLVVVPTSARRAMPARSTLIFPGTVTAEQLPVEYLTAVRWRLTGNWLVPLPLSPRP